MKELFELILSFFKKPDSKKPVDLDIVGDREELDIIPQETSKDPKKVIPVAYKKDSQRLKDEDKQLAVNNTYLHTLMSDLNDYTNVEFGKGIVITMIYRTRDEQDYLYRNSVKYKKKKFKSPHQFWHGVDIRSRTFVQSEIDQIVDWLNANHDAANYYKWTAKCHDVGSGMHFHIQFSR